MSCQCAIDEEKATSSLSLKIGSVNHVVQWLPMMRNIGQQDVAWLDVLLAPVTKLRLDRVREPANEHRQAETDGDRVAVGIEKADGKILGLIDDHVVGGPHEIGLHLIRDRHHRAADHFRREGVYPRCAQNLNWHISNLTLVTRHSPLHLITFSPRMRTSGGIVRPRALAVFKLIARSNFVGCSTGRSAGLTPFRILSTSRAASRPSAAKLGP
jgi:hypothetical protein